MKRTIFERVHGVIQSMNKLPGIIIKLHVSYVSEDVHISSIQNPKMDP